MKTFETPYVEVKKFDTTDILIPSDDETAGVLDAMPLD